jgi:acyl-CoA synthetase (AMP-forming)/AMP-acid ligase II
VLDASDLYRPSYVSMAPSTLVDLLTTLARTPRRTRKVAYLRLSGAYCTLATREKALCQFAEHVLTSYGATEIGRVALGDFEEIKGTEGSVGRIRDGVTVETVDENGQPLPAGSEGELRIKPPAGVAATYLGPDGDVDVLRDGWFYPGDIGCVDLSTGQLIFTGRKSTVINIGGTKISPEIVEGTLLEMPEIEDVAVAPMASEHGYQLICALVVDGGRLTLDDVTTFLLGRKRRFPVSALRSVASIPRTDNGKIDRPAVRAMAEGG